MAMLDKHVICCLDSIEKSSRARILKEMKEGGREVINISYGEMNEMCGNMIVLKDGQNGDLCLIMSKRALAGLT